MIRIWLLAAMLIAVCQGPVFAQGLFESIFGSGGTSPSGGNWVDQFNNAPNYGGQAPGNDPQQQSQGYGQQQYPPQGYNPGGQQGVYSDWYAQQPAGTGPQGQPAQEEYAGPQQYPQQQQYQAPQQYAQPPVQYAQPQYQQQQNQAAPQQYVAPQQRPAQRRQLRSQGQPAAPARGQAQPAPPQPAQYSQQQLPPPQQPAQQAPNQETMMADGLPAGAV
jgi:hypothetical protein